ncbi:hypothetical protein D3C80_1385030 [compost metagenome]
MDAAVHVEDLEYQFFLHRKRTTGVHLGDAVFDKAVLTRAGATVGRLQDVGVVVV